MSEFIHQMDDESSTRCFLDSSWPELLDPALMLDEAAPWTCAPATPPLAGSALDGASELPHASDPGASDACEQVEWQRYETANGPEIFLPDRSCQYCKAKHLQCYKLRKDASGCTPCMTLFRVCSFTEEAWASIPKPGRNVGFLDVLHSVNENEIQEQGDYTSIKPLFALGATAEDFTHEALADQSAGSDKKHTRFSKPVLQILKKWLLNHSDCPYPTESEREALQTQTGLNKDQISNWFSNARRRGKVRRRSSSGLRSFANSSPIAIPTQNDQSHMTPFERWQESPPEMEAAPLTAIARAAASTELPRRGSSQNTSRSASRRGARSSADSESSNLQAPSASSVETTNSSFSHTSSNASWMSSRSQNSYNNMAKQQRRRRRGTAPKISLSSQGDNLPTRPFNCTFCTDTFLTKYDWMRHEKSLHLSLEQWVCAPHGATMAGSRPGETLCVFCLGPNPDADHIESHNCSTCEEKGLEGRIFYRKDHLRQHLRLVHEVPMLEHMSKWVRAPTVVRSRCGFCPPESPATFTDWNERANHLAKHFRAGTKISQWQGDHGFDPEIAAMVQNNIQPYLICSEARSMEPYSAERANWCANWTGLTEKLTSWVAQQKAKGAEITDDGLRDKAQTLANEDSSAVNTSPADIPEWLYAFKRSHGLLSPADSSGQGLDTSATPGQSNDSEQYLRIRAEQFLQGYRRPTCDDILYTALSAYVRDRQAVGALPISDDELQRHARRIMFGNDDEWNGSEADDPQWLATFKKGFNQGCFETPLTPPHMQGTGGGASPAFGSAFAASGGPMPSLTPTMTDFCTPDYSCAPSDTLQAYMLPSPPSENLASLYGMDETVSMEHARLFTHQNQDASDFGSDVGPLGFESASWDPMFDLQ